MGGRGRAQRGQPAAQLLLDPLAAGDAASGRPVRTDTGAHECACGKREDLFALFFGLIVRDAQIQSLHGEPQRDLLDLTAQAIAGADDFLALTLRESAADGPTPRTLVQVRSAKDAVDCDIIALLAKRQSLVKQAAEIKKNDWPKSLESSVRDPARVRQVLEARTVEALKVGVDPRLINAIWPPMIATFIELELQHATRETPRS